MAGLQGSLAYHAWKRLWLPILRWHPSRASVPAPSGIASRRRHASSAVGVTATGHCLVATGRAEVMLDPLMKPWDCAALVPILEEAGGTFTDWDGKTTIYGGDAISTNGLLFDQVKELLEQSSVSSV